MPKNCMTAKSPQLLCDGCGGPATHMPVRLRGWWCSACCPACNAPGAPGRGAGVQVTPEDHLGRGEGRTA